MHARDSMKIVNPNIDELEVARGTADLPPENEAKGQERAGLGFFPPGRKVCGGKLIGLLRGSTKVTTRGPCVLLWNDSMACRRPSGGPEVHRRG